ncbi:hypothetical protein HMPREF1860_01875 [Prevotella amnii]|uniref:Uncharacterized protein n=2 Tax=Prevotella amnii TaxID=419005 RepID=A0A134B5B1_9BACT|nr:hypothetical protein HMPREF1860_01875 [Prevotella amnii]
MNIEKLRALFEKSTDKYGDAKEMGTTYQTLYNLIYKGSICKVDLLEKIAAFYRVPVGYFFDEVTLTQITALGDQSIATNSGDVTVGTQNKRDGDHIDTQNNCGCQNEEDRQDTVKTLTDTVATLTRELETSLQQKSSLIEIVANFQKQLQQFIEIMHHSNNK